VSYAVPLYAGRAGNICSVRQWVASALAPFSMDKAILPVFSSHCVLDPLTKQHQSPSVASRPEVQKDEIVDLETVAIEEK